LLRDPLTGGTAGATVWLVSTLDDVMESVIQEVEPSPVLCRFVAGLCPGFG
jgi:hypothetical protein